MTKEEFYTLATNRPVITGGSIYKLTIREIDKNATGYKKEEKSGDWCYEIGTSHNWYTSKDKAVKYMLKYIQEKDSHYRKNIHSALIERIPVNTLFEDGGQLEWWLYDKNGKQIDHSICAWEIVDDSKLRDVYLGRKPEEIPFKMGEIVEIVHDNKVVLSVINGIPLNIDEMWGIYEERFKKEGLKLDDRIMRGDFYDAMTDGYFYIRKDGYDLDDAPYNIMKPVFEVPQKVKEELSGRYSRWKNYMDTHSYEEVKWNELYKIVRGEA